MLKGAQESDVRAFGGIRDPDGGCAGLGECSSAAAPRRGGGGGWLPRAGGPWGGVAGVARGRHGGRVGCGAALPVIFLAKPGEGRWVTRGGVVLTVNGDRDEVERQLAGGELACPSCGGVLGGWGNGRLRRVRAAEGPDAEAGSAQVTVPPVRGDACAAAGVVPAAPGGRGSGDRGGAGGGCGRGRAPPDRRALGRAASTVRGWLRRFAGRAEEVRVFFTGLLARIAPDPVMPAGAAGAVAAAVSAIAGAASAVAARWPRARRGAGMGGGVGGQLRAAAGAGLAGRGAQHELTRYGPAGRRGMVSRSFH